MAGMSSDPLARPAGTIERFYWLLDQHACTNFVLAAELDPTVAREDLEGALERSWARHPRVRCRIKVDERGTVVLGPDAGGPPKIVPTEGAWRAVADAQLVSPFPAGSHPLIRCHWLDSAEGPTAVFTFEHGLLDAGSAAAWLLELLADACGHPPTQPFPTEVAPSEALYPARYRGLRGLLGLLRVIVLEGLGRRFAGTPQPLPGAPQWGTPRRPRTVHVDLDAQRSAVLVQRCREADCTVQGALMAAQAIALRGELPGDAPQPIGMAAAMDLRPWLDPQLPPGTLGNHVSLLPITVRVDPETSPVALAAEISGQLGSKIARGMGHLFWRIMPPAWFLPPDARSFPRLEAISRAAPPSTVVTNLGRLPDLPPGLAKALRTLRFTMAPQQGSPLCTGAATVNGALRLDLCFDGAHLDAEARVRVAGRVRQALDRLVKGEDRGKG